MSNALLPRAVWNAVRGLIDSISEYNRFATPDPSDTVTDALLEKIADDHNVLASWYLATPPTGTTIVREQIATALLRIEEAEIGTWPPFADVPPDFTDTPDPRFAFARRPECFPPTISERLSAALSAIEHEGESVPAASAAVDVQDTRPIPRWDDPMFTAPAAGAVEAAPGWTEKGEGETPRPADASLLPALLSASDIARQIGRKRESVSSFLTRFAERYRDCRTENPTRRRNEPAYLYRTADVWPALEKWLRENPTD